VISAIHLTEGEKKEQNKKVLSSIRKKLEGWRKLEGRTNEWLINAINIILHKRGGGRKEKEEFQGLLRPWGFVIENVEKGRPTKDSSRLWCFSPLENAISLRKKGKEKGMLFQRRGRGRRSDVFNDEGENNEEWFLKGLVQTLRGRKGGKET